MKNRIMDHLANLVNYYPVSSDQNAVKLLLEYCSKIIGAAGGFSDLEILNSKGVNNLYASTRSTKKPRVMLNGHIDVVAASKPQRTMTINGNKAIGRGVYDDLFATAIFLTLIEDIKDELNQLDIGIMLTGDEELGGFNGTKALVDKGYLPSISIMPDAGEGFGDLNIGCRGIYNFELTISGKSHHGSRPWDGDGAASKIISLLSELAMLTPNKETSSFTIVPTKLNAGDSINKAPAVATAHLDIRYETQADLIIVKKELGKLLEKYNGSINEVSVGSNFNLDLQNGLVKEFLEHYKFQAHKVTYSKTTGSSDARFFASKNIPVIMFRPEGGGIHGDNEWLNAGELEKTYNLIKEYLLKVAKI
jgi:succinyl-diaminopimelate desuccinylase